MRFFVDENFSPAVADALGFHLPQHEFFAAHGDEGRYRGVEDLELFPVVAEDGFEVFLTFDRAQMRSGLERQSMRASGLHWFGIREPSEGGITGITLTTASLLAGVPYAIAATDEAGAPLAVWINQVLRKPNQRIRHEAL